MGYPKFIVSNQKGESISIQRVKPFSSAIKNLQQTTFSNFVTVFWNHIRPDITCESSASRWFLCNIKPYLLENEEKYHMICPLLQLWLALLELTLCLLGNFSCFFWCLLIFFKIIFFEKFFQEYHQCQIVWIQIRPDILSGLIWVETICKGYQRSTHSRQRVKWFDVHIW